MDTALIIFLAALVLWGLYKLLSSSGQNNYNRDTSRYNRSEENYVKEESNKVKKWKSFFSLPKWNIEKANKKSNRQSFTKELFSNPSLFDNEAIDWCANFLLIKNFELTPILYDIPRYYTHFKIGKRRGGYRIISAPKKELLNLQKIIYQRILLPVNIHPASTGFRQNISVKNNASPHLKNKQVLKVDIRDFFGVIKKKRILNTFEKMGYPTNISKVLAEICTLDNKLPQGAATSPALSNIVAYSLDVKLADLAKREALTYTRYADDLTFSGENISFKDFLLQIEIILASEKFGLQRKKTRLSTERKRKIITGISISSGEKMTIPKAKKREVRKNVHFILTKGLAEHQRFIGSNDPAYLKRLIGYLHFWQMVEPDNAYVQKSLTALNKL